MKSYIIGAMYVEREVNGVVERLFISSQWAYKEWPGCFTLIDWRN